MKPPSASPFLLAAVLWAMAGSASAQSCDALRPGLEAARSSLELAALEANFAKGKDLARQSRVDLVKASTSAQNCGCMTGFAFLDDASFEARLAGEARSVREFSDYLRRAIHHFDDSLGSLESCAPLS